MGEVAAQVCVDRNSVAPRSVVGSALEVDAVWRALPVALARVEWASVVAVAERKIPPARNGVAMPLRAAVPHLADEKRRIERIARLQRGLSVPDDPGCIAYETPPYHVPGMDGDQDYDGDY